MSNESPPMYLYLVERTDYIQQHDQYDSMVVAAPNEEKASFIHPDIDDGKTDKWDGINSRSDTWTSRENVQVTCIGVACEGTEKGIILKSFNAG